MRWSEAPAELFLGSVAPVKARREPRPTKDRPITRNCAMSRGASSGIAWLREDAGAAEGVSFRFSSPPGLATLL